MADVNKVILIGNIDSAPMVETGQDGRTNIDFQLITKAVSYNRGDGEKKTTSMTHSIHFITRSLKVADYLSQGRQVFVEGTLKRYGGEIYVETRDVQLVGGRPSTEGPSKAYSAKPAEDEDLPY